MDDRLVTLADAAPIVDVPRSTLYRWAADEEHGVAPVHTMRGTARSGRVAVYKLSEVSAMVDYWRRRHAATRSALSRKP